MKLPPNAETGSAQSPALSVQATNSHAPHELSRRLRWNAASGMFRFAVLTLVYFVTYPYMLHKLGSERFAMWALALVISQSLGTQDLGLAGALMKFVPEHWSNKDFDRICQLVSTTTLVLGSIGIVLGLGVLVMRNWLAGFLRIPPQLRNEMAWLLAGMGGVFLLNLLCSGLSAVLIGIQRMDASNLAYVMSAVIQGAGVFWVLSHGYGLLGLLANTALMSLLWGTSTWVLLHRYLPGFRFQLSAGWRRDAACLTGYGLNIQAASMGSLLTIPPIKVFLSRYVSLSSVSFFELASGMAMQLRSGFLMAAMPLTSASAQLRSEGADDRVARLYQQSFRYLFFGALPVFSCAAALAPGFINSWLGRNTPYVAATLGLLLVGWFLNLLSVAAFFMLQGQGFARFQMYSTALQAVCSIVLGYILVRIGGYYGAVSGLAAALTIAAVYLLWWYPRLCGGSSNNLLDGSLVKAFVINGLLFAVFLAKPELRQVSHLPGLVVLASVYLSVYFLLITVFGCLAEGERELLALAWPPNAVRWLVRKVRFRGTDRKTQLPSLLDKPTHDF